ncbi:MAG TPA: hypothetical protein VIM53_02615 [Candidatus Saccharimonadales bacterium]
MGEISRFAIEGNRGRLVRKVVAAAGGIAALASIGGCVSPLSLDGPEHVVGSNPAAVATTHEDNPTTVVTFTAEETPAFRGTQDTNDSTMVVTHYSKGQHADVVCEKTGREYEHDGRKSDVWLMVDTGENPFVSVLDVHVDGSQQPQACTGLTQ